MAKKEGKPKKRRKPLPDPKDWKWCKHPECLEQAKKLEGFGSGGKEEWKLMHKNSQLCAVFGEEYCWKHLLTIVGSQESAYKKFKKKIEDYVKTGNSLEGANLRKVELPQAKLRESNLEGVNLIEANLQEADLRGAKLQQVKLWDANLSEANLKGANLKDADLQNSSLVNTNLSDAILQGANLQETRLWGVDLTRAFLWRSNFHRAELLRANLFEADMENVKLHGAWLYGINLHMSRGLTWTSLREVGKNTKNVGKARTGEDISGDWRRAIEVYLILKNYFHQQGRYDDESKAYYREKLMAKHEAYDQCFKKKQPKHFFTWFGLWLLWAVAGFGERWMRIIPWGAGILAFFTGLFFLGSNLGWGAPYNHPTLLSIGNLFDCFVFSVVTFVTLGFGAIWSSAWLAKLLIILEAALGFVFLGMFVVLIARRFGR